jgi:hypothetical protein
MNHVIEDNILINLNSKYGNSNNGTYNSDVLFNTGALLLDESNILYSEIQLLNASFPLSMFIIDSTNNIFNYSVSSINYNYIFPIGNYPIQILINYLNAELSTKNIVVSLIQITGCLKFTGLITIYNYSTCNTILGIGSNNLISSSNITLPYPVNLIGTTQIKICSEIMACGNIDFGGVNNILNVVYVNNCQNGIQTYDINFHKNILTSRQINNIDIQILDQNNNYINFNSCSWQLTFKIIKYRFLILANRISIYDFLMDKSKKNIKDDSNIENEII